MRPGLGELARAFTRLGLTAFGGPAAHIAVMQREFVERRAWLSQRRFLDLIGMSSLLPGPSSTEVALGIGYERGRWPGLGLAALGFIGPAALITLVLAMLYVEAGTISEARWLLYGMAPVVVAVIAHAMLSLVPSAFTDRLTWLVGIAALAASLVVAQPILVLAGAALALVLARRGRAWFGRGGAGAGSFMLGLPGLPDGSMPGPMLGAAAVATGAATLGLGAIFWTFLKIGVVVFGSGYVLIAFLGAELVEPGIITEQQLLDAIAIGQLTPGPVFTTATFIGYLLAGIPGAIVATLGIFLPAIVLVGLVHPWLDRMRANATISAAIDGLNAAAIGLIGYSVVLLAGEAFLPDGALDLVAVALGAGAFVVLMTGRLGPVPLLLAGALVGLASQVLRV